MRTIFTLFFFITVFANCQTDECVDIFERVESNLLNAKRAAVGLENDYPLLQLESDSLIRCECGREFETYSDTIVSGWAGFEVLTVKTYYSE